MANTKIKKIEAYEFNGKLYFSESDAKAEELKTTLVHKFTELQDFDFSLKSFGLNDVRTTVLERLKEIGTISGELLKLMPIN